MELFQEGKQIQACGDNRINKGSATASPFGTLTEQKRSVAQTKSSHISSRKPTLAAKETEIISGNLLGRPDLVTKSMLRDIRRFFRDEFKAFN